MTFFEAPCTLWCADTSAIPECLSSMHKQQQGSANYPDLFYEGCEEIIPGGLISSLTFMTVSTSTGDG